jgi:hypothetical protein
VEVVVVEARDQRAAAGVEDRRVARRFDRGCHLVHPTAHDPDIDASTLDLGRSDD